MRANLIGGMETKRCIWLESKEGNARVDCPPLLVHWRPVLMR